MAVSLYFSHWIDVMKRFFVFFLLIGLVINVNAQRDTVESEYLIKPSGQSYFLLLEKLLAEDEIDHNSLKIILSEMQVFERINDSLTSDSVLKMYYLLADSTYTLNHAYWIQQFIELRFAEDSIELSEYDNLQFENFNIDIQEVDFLNDGEPEYILEITSPIKKKTTTADYDFEAYMIAYQDDNQIEVVRTPMGYNGLYVPSWVTQRWQTLHLEDINNDDKLEWVMLGYGHNSGRGAQWRAKHYVLAWQEDKLINLAPDSLGFNNYFYESSSWEYANLDKDDAIEIFKINKHANNWHCQYESHYIYDWDAEIEQYVESEPTVIIPDSYGCLWTDAEEAMRQDDFETALPLYEKGIQLALKEDFQVHELELLQYIQIRQILAYALSGNTEIATQNLLNLLNQENLDDDIHELAENMAQAYIPDSNIISLCSSVYNYFYEYQIQYTNSPFSNMVGATYVDSELSDFYNTGIVASSAGCDIVSMIESGLNDVDYPIGQSPSYTFEEKDIPITRTINFDLNLDGIDEWVLWVEADIPAFFFAPNVGTGFYTLSRPFYHEYDDFQLYVFELPDDAGIALARYTFDVPSKDQYWLGHCGYDKDTGILTISRLNGDRMANILRTGICEEQDWGDVISEDGKQVYAWRGNGEYLGESLYAATYIWDSETMKYEWEQTSSVTPTPIYEPAPYNPAEGEINMESGSLRRALVEDINTIESNLIELEAKLAEYYQDNVSESVIYNAYYNRALALLMLNRDDEAVAQFIEIVDDVPNSIWGQLSYLYLESVP